MLTFFKVHPGKKGMIDLGSAKEEVAVTRLYTHEDLESFPDDEVWELLKGFPTKWLRLRLNTNESQRS
jgi:hypothetical protein